eukprot:TRINITY_DN245_c0_g1_i12.p1 TRINITY_DN245_c0_g1~~TRINITY_DN245_c0_g1_i12.p1  ORF type:complete len:305 (-),score=52.90 TRINITY_DN245_c0_g1_i12:89-1003(-)
MDLVYSLIYQKNLNLGKDMKLQLQDSYTDYEKKFMAGRFFSSVLKLRTAEEEEESTDIKWVNNWNIIILIGNLLQITGTIVYLLEVREGSRIPSTLMGLGCFCAWVNSTRYLKMNMEYYMMFVTIVKSLPEIFKFFLSVLPIFIGSILLICCVLWVSEYFVSPGKGLIVGFALYLGDIVTDSSERLPVISFFWGNAYIYCFIIFFMLLVHTILQGIISLTYTRDVQYLYAKKPESANELKEKILKHIAMCEATVLPEIDSMHGLLLTMQKGKSIEEKGELLREHSGFINRVRDYADELSLQMKQ